MIKKDYVCRHGDGRHVQTEKTLLEQCGRTGTNAPFVCELFGTFQDKKFIYFVLSYAAGGELFSRLHDRAGTFGPQTARFYLAEILLAVAHVQSLGYAYRDLKPENVMLDEEGHCKLIDFGFAAKPDGNGLLHTNVGTPAYLSPEQLNHKKTGGYRTFVDWWSFGILTYEFLTGYTPFCKDFKESSYAIYTRVMKGTIKYPGSYAAFPRECREMVGRLCCHDVEGRMKDAESVKKCAFFEGVDWEKVRDRQAVPPHVPRLKEPGDCRYFQKYGELNEKEREPEKIDHGVFKGF